MSAEYIEHTSSAGRQSDVDWCSSEKRATIPKVKHFDTDSPQCGPALNNLTSLSLFVGVSNL